MRDAAVLEASLRCRARTTTKRRRQMMVPASGPPIGRRLAMGVSAATGTGTLLTGGAARAQAPMRTSQRTFVLVHGAWHGGWCWRRVSDLLQAEGHKVFSPTLSGLAERSGEMDRCRPVTLATHVADIVDLFHWERLSDVVLCGHSYGGMVIAGAAEKLMSATGALRSMVYLDAFVPGDGQALVDMAPPPTRDLILKLREKGERAVPPVPAATFNVNERDRDWVNALCTPQPIGTFLEPARIGKAQEQVPRRTYIRAVGYRSLPFDAARAAAAAAGNWNVLDLDAGHDAMIDRPHRLAEMLIAAA